MRGWLLVVLIGCGAKPVPPLTGDVAVSFVWHGTWPTDRAAAAATFVRELSDSTYFDPLLERGIRPRFIVADAGGILIHMYMPGSTDQPPCGWHGFSDGAPYLGVLAICSMTVTLSHELVETAVDPDGSGAEVADLCDSHAPIDLPSGRLQVAQYMTSGGCVPR